MLVILHQFFKNEHFFFPINNRTSKSFQNDFHMQISIFFIIFPKILYLIKNTIFYWQYLARKMVDPIWSIFNEGLKIYFYYPKMISEKYHDHWCKNLLRRKIIRYDLDELTVPIFNPTFRSANNGTFSFLLCTLQSSHSESEIRNVS